MRIGIDGRELAGRPTGVGRYLAGLLHEWATSERARRHEFVLYAHEPLTAVTLDTRHFATRVVSGGSNTQWEQQQLPAAMAKDHLDVFFAPAYTAPVFTRTPIVVAIHDVSFAAHPEWFTPRQGIRQRFFSRRAARSARAVVTISEFSRREIVELLRVPESHVHVIPPGVSSPLSGFADRTRPVSQPADPPGRRLLYVGSIFNRRHVPDLIRAFGRVARAHPDAELDLVGDNRSYPREDVSGALAGLGLASRARWHRYLSDDDLAGLYQSSRAFAFLSEYEGLGFTPLEALMCGVPSVLLDTPIARESCAGAALYVAKGDVKGTAATIERLLYDSDIRAQLLAEGPGVLARYDWPRAADATLALLERAA